MANNIAIKAVTSVILLLFLGEYGTETFFVNAGQIGDPCDHDIGCFSLGPLSQCHNGFCKCKDGEAVPSSDLTKCLEVIHVLQKGCQENSQCHSGTPGAFSECKDNRCQCTDKGVSIQENQYCFQSADFVGDRCQVNEQCTENLGGNSVCTGPYANYVCNCQKAGGTASKNNRKCLPLVRQLHGDCLEDSQCQGGTPGPLSHCQRADNSSTGSCECNDDAINWGEDQYCYKKANFIREPCVVHSQCWANLGTNSGCIGPYANHYCSCEQSGGIASADNTKCLPIVQILEGSCQENQQCQGGAPGAHSVCGPDNKCICSSDSLNEVGKYQCHKKVNFVGEGCSIHGQCDTLGNLTLASCSNGLCSCHQGKSIPSEDNKKCIEIVNILGNVCQEDRQCQMGEPGEYSVCSNSLCTCKSGAVNQCPSNKCLPIAKLLGDDCQTDAQCQEALGPLTVCSGGKCNCNGDAHPSPDCSKQCIPNDTPFNF